MTKTTFTAALAAMALLSGASQAFAGEASDTVAFKVSTWGLNLADPADAKTMLGRIERASAQACGEPPVIADLAGRQAFNACLDHNVSLAVHVLNAPLVTALAHQTPPRTLASISR